MAKTVKFKNHVDSIELYKKKFKTRFKNKSKGKSKSISKSIKKPIQLQLRLKKGKEIKEIKNKDVNDFDVRDYLV